MDEILSFESGVGEIFGDLLSKKTEPCEFKIGFLACGYFEYWRMFSPQFKINVENLLNKIAEKLEEKNKVVFPGIVDTLDKADEAGKIFRDEKVDLIIVCEGTYVPDYMSMQAIDYNRDVPVLLFDVQAMNDITPEDDYEVMMENSSLIGTAQLSGSFRKMGKTNYDIVVGSLEEGVCFEEIDEYVSLLKIIKDLRNLNIGVVGHVFRGMYDLENDKTKIKGTLGPNVIYVELSHLLRLWRETSEKEAEEEADKFASRFTVKGVKREDIVKSVRLGLAMKNLIDKYRLDSLCFLGQHFIEKETGAPARIGASMIMDNPDNIVASEGDLAGLVMMKMMYDLTGNVPLQAEWGQYDLSHNAIFLVGHGVASSKNAKSEKDISLTTAPEEWGFEGTGCNMEFIMKPGHVTMGHLLNTFEGWQMLVSEGESLDYPCLPCNEIHALVEVKKPVKEFVAELHKVGVTHHVIVCHGDCRKQLIKLAELMKIKVTEI